MPQRDQNDKSDTRKDGRQGTSARGFAAMDPEKQRRIASQGGRAAHAKGTAHEFTSREASIAGAKGGQARANQNRNKTDMSRGNR